MIDPKGDITPCCFVSDMPKFNIKSDGLKKYHDSEWYKEFVKSHHNNQRHSACEKCWMQEDEGIKSKRQLDIEKVGEGFEYDKRENPPKKNIEMTFGNLCNLACRICHPEYSSKWVSEKGRLGEKKYPIYTWHKDQRLMSNIKEITASAERMTIVGGEPFLTEIPEHEDFLRYFVEIGQAEKLTLHYITNGTTFPSDTIISLLKKFKSIDIQLSIDGTGAQFEYNRWPGKWKTVHENIKKYQSLTEETKNITISISHTISAFTIYYVEEFVLWCLREKLPFPYFNQLLYSIHNRASVFRPKTKDVIRKKLLSSKSKQIVNLVSWLDLSDDSEHFGKFEEQVKLYDKVRGQNFSKTFPELHKIL